MEVLSNVFFTVGPVVSPCPLRDELERAEGLFLGGQIIQEDRPSRTGPTSRKKFFQV